MQQKQPHLTLIYHPISIMTSFPTFTPSRVNDLPFGTTRGLRGALGDKSYPDTSAPDRRVTNWVSSHSRCYGPSSQKPKSLCELDDSGTKSVHQQPERHFLVLTSGTTPDCNSTHPGGPRAARIAHEASRLFPALMRSLAIQSLLIREL